MTGNRTIPQNNVVKFFAAEISETGDGTVVHANDNCCPHCGGVLLPGDKASDCSGSLAQPMRARPREQGVH